jgi:serine/threonine-protein kinase
VLNRQGKYQEAIKAFRDACLAAPGSSLAFNNVGAIYLQIGEFPAATENFKKSFALKPNGMAASNSSLALRSEGKDSEALPFALKAVELDPTNDSNWLELGDCYSSLRNHRREAKGAYLRAAEEAEQHLQTNPADGPTWMLLALYQVKSDGSQNALSLIKKAELLGADDMDSQLSKARILELLGRRDEALATLATCFRKGATRFQIAPTPDLLSLQKDPRYQELLRSDFAPEKRN